MFHFKAVGTVFKTEHLTAPSLNHHITSHTVGTVCPNVCWCVNLLLHVDSTLSNYIDADPGSKRVSSLSQLLRWKFREKRLIFQWMAVNFILKPSVFFVNLPQEPGGGTPATSYRERHIQSK